MQIHLIMLSEEGSTYVALEARETSQCFKCTYNGEVIQLRKADEYKFSAGRGFCTAIMYGRDFTELVNGFRKAVVISNLPVTDISDPQAADGTESHVPETEASASPEEVEINTGAEVTEVVNESDDKGTHTPDMLEMGDALDATAEDTTPDTTATSCNPESSVLVNVMLPFQREESEQDSVAAVAIGNEIACGFCGGVFDSFLAEIETLPDGNIAAKCPYCGTELQDADQLASKQIIIHTDGACLGNPGPGGWAAILHSGKWEKALSGGDADTTNNRMEIMGALSALQWLHDNSYKGRVTVISDSQYLVHAITKHWAENWQRGGWIKGDGKPAKNPDLWQRLLELIKAFDKVDFLWVKGHAGDYYNERCDRLANREAGIAG